MECKEELKNTVVDLDMNYFKNTGEKIRMIFPEDIVIKISDKAQIKYDAVCNEIVDIFLINSDRSIEKEFKQNPTLSTGKFTFNSDTREIEFFKGEVPYGSSIVAYYFRDIMEICV